MFDIEKDPRGTPASQRLGYSSYRLARAFTRFMENVALAEGLTLSQLFAVQVLGEGVPLSNSQLARRTFVSAQAAHTVANELIKAGIMERGNHPVNRRIRLVRLTEKGWEVLDRCTTKLVEHEERLCAILETTDLGDVLGSAADALAGGYFGDDEAEARAIEARMSTVRPRHIPSRLAAARLRAERQENGGDDAGA